jgi:transcriptional regulator with XRE-family HTH domain
MEPLQPLLRELIGDALRRERHRQSRTLVQVAEASGVSMQHLSDVERGRKDPSSEVLAAILGALDLQVLDLIERQAAPDGEYPVLELAGGTQRRRSAAIRPLPSATVPGTGIALAGSGSGAASVTCLAA